MPEKIKIAIADDHNLVRQSIALALDCEPAFKIVGQAGNGQVLLEIVEKQSPGVIILDLEMPVMNGWQTLDQLKKEYPDCKVIILSMHFEGLLIKDLIAKGARGFLPKNSDFETLINAIYEVNDVGYFFSKKISHVLVKELLMSNAITPSFNEPQLTDKEIKTLMLVCNDKLTTEMAITMNVSERTIERYKMGLYKKTKAKTSAGLVLYALKNNLFSAGR